MAAASHKDTTNFLALDVGDARVGVAMANSIARLPNPLAIIENDADVFDNLRSLIKENSISTLIVGLPRNMKGEETQQSQSAREFGEKLKEATGLPVIYADESLSTKRAEEYARQLKRTSGHLDDIAACFILEEYLGVNNG